MANPDMIEKVARAIFNRRYPAANPDAVLVSDIHAWEVYKGDAQAAIDAIAPDILDMAADEVLTGCYMIGAGTKDAQSIARRIFALKEKFNGTR